VVDRIGAALLAATGLLHLVLAPEYIGEQAYLGVLSAGLPAFYESAWELSGILSLVLEAGFIAALIARARPQSHPPRAAYRRGSGVPGVGRLSARLVRLDAPERGEVR
jgi:hypothetical protein